MKYSMKCSALVGVLLILSSQTVCNRNSAFNLVKTTPCEREMYLIIVECERV